MRKAEKRRAETDGLFAKLYEDWAAGRITEYNFNMLTGKYQTEQAELDEKIAQYRAELENATQKETDVQKWVELLKRYTAPTELTAELLNALIEKIVVHEATKRPDGTRTQDVEIYYRFIGRIE